MWYVPSLLKLSTNERDDARLWRLSYPIRTSLSIPSIHPMMIMVMVVVGVPPIRLTRL